jgi:hypothetical protein
MARSGMKQAGMHSRSSIQNCGEYIVWTERRLRK